ncbi:MAG: hypothetical protein Q9225_002820 [Loekoesia sp. 1 TL-2023]
MAFIGTAVFNLYFHPLAKYPGPASRAAFFLPDALSKLRGTGYKDTKLLHDKYGTVVRIQPDALSYNSACAWKDIYGLKSDRTELAKDPAYYKKGEATNILVANQTNHNRIRKLLAHAFSDSALLEQEPILTSYFDLLVSKLKQQVDGPAHGRVDMMAYYNFVAFDIIGPSFSAKRVAHLSFTEVKTQKRLDRKTDRKDFMTYVCLPPFSLHKIDPTRQILRYNNEGGLSQKDLIGNSRVLLTAGSETTATLLSGATYYLLQTPDVLRRVQSEVRTAFKQEEDITLRSVSSPSLLPYLEAVIQESLRCYPSIPATLPRRTGPEGALIDGRFVPGNTSVGVHQWSTYRSNANFASPDKFAPERWFPDPPPEYRRDNKAVLQPFSLGPRGCLGKSLAYFEVRSILARVLWNFDMELEEESQGWTEQKEYTLWDKPPLWVRLKHKGAAVGK